jgi:hypothetical protein
VVLKRLCAPCARISPGYHQNIKRCFQSEEIRRRKPLWDQQPSGHPATAQRIHRWGAATPKWLPISQGRGCDGRSCIGHERGSEGRPSFGPRWQGPWERAAIHFSSVPALDGISPAIKFGDPPEAGQPLRTQTSSRYAPSVAACPRPDKLCQQKQLPLDSHSVHLRTFERSSLNRLLRRAIYPPRGGRHGPARENVCSLQLTG